MAKSDSGLAPYTGLHNGRVSVSTAPLVSDGKLIDDVHFW